jgi:pSer/pThr/pTyr-binding forkhead associated (FHA) protein
MNANLVLLNKRGSHKTFALPHPVTVLGRRHDCDLRIPLPIVSRRHCQLAVNKESAKLRDLGSRAGTFVNGKRIDPEEDVPVKAGDYITIGPLTFVCQIDGKPAKIAPPKKEAPQRDASRSGAKAVPAAAKAKPQKAAAPAPSGGDLGSELDAELDGKLGGNLDAELDGELSDLDVSDSFINLDDLDADLEDLKDA